MSTVGSRRLPATTATTTARPTLVRRIGNTSSGRRHRPAKRSRLTSLRIDGLVREQQTAIRL